MNFEQSIISAIETELPLELIDGCFFLYTQSLWKRLGEFGLIASYKNDQEFKGILRKIMALGFNLYREFGLTSTSITPRVSTVS